MTFGGVVSFYLWIWALERTTPSSVAVTITINPFAAAVLGALILDEPITLHMLRRIGGRHRRDRDRQLAVRAPDGADRRARALGGGMR